MKAIAIILSIYLFGLCIQPAVFPHLIKEKKAMSCCQKNKKAHRSCGNDCCGDSPCNPFFSQCPVCAATAIVSPKYIFDVKPLFTEQKQFLLTNESACGAFRADLLRPPQEV